MGAAELQNSMWRSLVPVVRIWSLWFILRSLLAFSLKSLSDCIFMNKVQLSEPGKRLVKLILSLNDSSVDLSYVWNVLLPLLRLVQ